MAMPAAKLPSVQRTKLDTFKAADAAGQPAPVQIKPSGATAVVSMTPGPRASAPAAEAPPLDENEFAVEPVHAESGAPVSAPVAEDRREETEEERYQKWGRENPELYHRYKTAAGMYEKAKSDLQGVKSEALQTKMALEKLQEEVTSLRAVKPVAAEPKKSLRELLTDEEANYETAVPVIEKLGRRIAEDEIESRLAPLRAELEELRTSNKTVTTTQKETDERAFVNNVRSRVKNFDAIVANPEWTAYVSTRVPYTDYTLGDMLTAAHQARSLDRVAEIFEGFKPASKDNLETLVTPTVSRTGTDPTRAPQKPILKWSERVKAGADFTKGRIPKDKFEQIAAMYKAAEAEGRIDMKA